MVLPGRAPSSVYFSNLKREREMYGKKHGGAMGAYKSKVMGAYGKKKKK